MQKKELERINSISGSEKPFSYLLSAFSFPWGQVPAAIPHTSWAVEFDGKLVAGAGYLIAETAPDLALIGIVVQPAYRRQGIGSATYRRLLDALHLQGVQRLLTGLYSTQLESSCFLSRHGFQPIGSSLYYQLAVAAPTADPDAADAIVAGQGLRFATLDRFPRRGLAERLLPLWNTTRPDQPGYWPYLPYSARRLEREMLEPAEVALAHSLAIVGPNNQVVALALSAWLDAQHLGSIYLAVDPAYRRRGLATALKLKLIAHARQHAIAYLVAENDARNTTMRVLNTRLGYQQLAEMIVYQKLLN